PAAFFSKPAAFFSKPAAFFSKPAAFFSKPAAFFSKPAAFFSKAGVAPVPGIKRSNLFFQPQNPLVAASSEFEIGGK
ncbi:hypothetical protein, partial [Bacteroides pyogenes]|uniref:hypothetical protein n=1 Tax=Bacteroides pyogenes TaxID=310300 RepID=UPI001CA31F62